MQDGIYNAVIKSARLGFEDHGILTFAITVDHEYGTQAFGNYNLTNAQMKVISRILKAVGVNSWEELKGKYVRIKISDSYIKGIGHIINKHDWFDPEVDMYV